MRFRVVLVLAALAATLLAPVARAADAPDHSDAVVVVGRDVSVDRPVDRIVVVGGDVGLGPSARVDGDVIVLFGKLQRSPAAQVGGSEYVLDRDLIDWIPGPGWVAGVLLLVALLVYRIAVWAAVCAIAALLSARRRRAI